MPTSKTIYFDADGYQLVGTLHLPDTPEPPVVIGCHGLLANRHSPKQIALAAACNRNGMAYFRFDHRGCGESQGEFSKVTSLAARRQDLYHAIKTMQHQSGLGPLAGIFGSSFGGSVAISYAAAHSSPAIVTYAAPLNSITIHHANIRDNNGDVPMPSQLTDALTFDLSHGLGKVDNILVTHSENDETVPVCHAQQIHQKVKHPKKLIIFKGGDHRMSDTRLQQQLEKNFINWLISH